ncbi:MAG: hypothetical protein ACKOCT_12205 [Alphaproteobacteria bacterium]
MTPPAISPGDDRPHPPGPEVQWSESCSFWLHDPGSGLAGSLRVALRPNEGMMDAGLHFWLPDGGFVATRHVSTPSADAVRFEVGDARLEVVEPLRRWRLLHDGPAHSLDSAADAGDREAWHHSRVERLIVELDFAAETDAVGFSETGAGVPSPREGFEQAGAWTGLVQVSGAAFEIAGHGFRERSWGLRDWQAPVRTRRFAFRVGGDVAVSAAVVEGEGGVELRHGWIAREGRVERLRSVRAATDTAPDGLLPRSIRLEPEDASGGFPVATGDVAGCAPIQSVRNQR